MYSQWPVPETFHVTPLASVPLVGLAATLVKSILAVDWAWAGKPLPAKRQRKRAGSGWTFSACSFFPLNQVVCLEMSHER